MEKKTPFQVEALNELNVPEKFVEIVEGELVIMTPAGRYHNRIAYRFQRLFDTFCSTRPNLDFGGDNDGFLLQRDPDLLFSPDASLFTTRPDTEFIWMEFAPEIAVEVLSPSNNQSEMIYKRREYFNSGTEQVWIVDPIRKTIEIYSNDGRHWTAQGNQELSCVGVVEGLTIDVADIFRI